MTDFYPQDASARQDAGTDFLAIIDDLIAIVENAKSMPLSSSALISREEVIDLLLSARESLPNELARARGLLIERNEMWAQAERDANALIDEARAQAAHLVQRTEVVRQANAHADRLISEAEIQAVSMRREAEDYIDKKLAAAEIVIDRVARTLGAGREKLKPNLVADLETSEDEAPEDRSSARPDLFDQDFR